MAPWQLKRCPAKSNTNAVSLPASTHSDEYVTPGISSALYLSYKPC